MAQSQGPQAIHADTPVYNDKDINVAKGLEAATEQVESYDEETRLRLSKAITRKFDLRIMPLCTMMQFCSIIDRSNMGNASVLGMNEDLQLTGYRLNISLSVFCATYIAFEMYDHPTPSLCSPSSSTKLVIKTQR
jgi:hypothetical protein